MSDGLHSELWYRVANVRPKLRASTRMARHQYRGETWYVLRDSANGENVRINNITRELLRHLNGHNTLDDAYRAMLTELGDDAPTQQDIIVGMAQLAEANLVQADRVADLAQLRLTARRRRRREWTSRVNPLSFQVALFDPSRIVDRIIGLGDIVFSRISAYLVGLAFVLALMIALVNGTTLSNDLARISSSGTFLFLMWLIYPLAKAVHEFAHALAVRQFGGEVTEMGLRLLILMPMPYVDASSASLFPDKKERAIVSAAGIMAELVMASLATFAWLALEPGLLRDMALATMIITSVSTFFFNGNPLLKFDGYFVMTDCLELPNLAQRARQLWISLLKRHALRLPDVQLPHLARGERPWLLGYALASWAYRLVLFCSIAILIAEYSVVLGLLVLVFGLWNLVLKPIFNTFDFLLGNPQLNGRRAPVAVAGSAVLALGLAGSLVPVSDSTAALGVVWLSEHAHVRSPVSGTIKRFLATPNTLVAPGQPLIELENPDLHLKVATLSADLQALRAEYLEKLNEGSAEATLTSDAIDAKKQELITARERSNSLTVRAATPGRFIVAQPADQIGRWFEQGQQIAYLLNPESASVRVALPNADANRVRESTRSVAVRLIEAPSRRLRGTVRKDSQSGSYQLPSPALGHGLGGWIETDPKDKNGTSTIAPIFVLDIDITALPELRAGQRALVRFEHPSAPVLEQARMLLQQLFLRHFTA